MNCVDLFFIAGDFLYDDSISKEQQWLFKYLKTPEQRRFLCYYKKFVSLRDRKPIHFYRSFLAHTGVSCTLRAVQKWRRKLLLLEKLVADAYKNLDLAFLEELKSGNFQFTIDERSKISIGDGVAM